MIENNTNHKSSGKIGSFLNHQPTVLLAIVAIAALSASFFVSGFVRALFGIVCIICSLVLLQRAIGKSVKNRSNGGTKE